MQIEHEAIQRFLTSDFAQIFMLLIITVTPVVVGAGFRQVLKHWKIFIANMKWIRMEIKTMDYALQRSFKNGYSDYKKEAKKKMLETLKDKQILEDSDFDIEL